MTRRTSPGLAILAILVAGTTIRIASALAPGSMWFDELHTAVNVTGRDWTGILEPLAYHQVAPVGFIAAEMASVSLFGLNETALRAIPLAASILSLFLFWRLATRFLTGTAFYGALATFAVNPALVWYARTVKQYSGDLCVVLALMLLSIRFLERPQSSRYAAIGGVVGGIGILFSQPAAAVAVALLLLLLVRQLRERLPLWTYGALSALWLLGGAVQVVTSLRLAPHGTLAFMSNAWQSYFPDRNGPAVTVWLSQRLFQFVGFGAGLIRADSMWEVVLLSVYSLLVLFGAFYLYRRRSLSVAVLFTPIAVAILLSMGRVLPLSGRVMIYVIPTFVVVCFAGIARLDNGPFSPTVRLLTVVLIAVQAAFLPLIIPVLSGRQDAESVLLEVKGRWRRGDTVLVNAGGVPAMRFYGSILGFDSWLPGVPPGADGRASLRQVDDLRGRPRAWFFYTHVLGCQAALVQSYLETIGIEIDRIEDPRGITGMHQSGARLYDLSDAALLSRSNAESQPLLVKGDPLCRGRQRSAGQVIKDRIADFFNRLGDRFR